DDVHLRRGSGAHPQGGPFLPHGGDRRASLAARWRVRRGPVGHGPRGAADAVVRHVPRAARPGPRGAGVTDLKRTPLHGEHVSAGAKMVEFAGYEMPIQYPTGIVAEHRAVRTTAGLFDLSHMGEFLFTGDAAGAAID